MWPLGGKTKAEAKALARTKSWAQRIAEADAREYGQFTKEDIDLASNWVTCACGERDDILLEDDAPSDTLLLKLGNRFLDAVLDSQPGRAAEVLAKIQERAAHLVRVGLAPGGYLDLRKED